MEHRPFGRTGLEVSAVGFGCWEIGGGYGDIEEAEFVRAVGRALDLGINCFDTAEGYGMGASERALGQALGRRRDEAIIVTKFGMNYRDKPNLRDSSRERVIASIDKSLKNLGTDYVDVYLVHWPDRLTPFEETMQRARRHRPRRQGPLRRPLELQARGDRGVHGACGASTSCSTAGTCSTGACSARSSRTARSTASASWRTARSRSGCSRARSPRTWTSAAPTGAPGRGRWARSRCSTSLFGPEKFKDNVRAVEELKGIAARYDKSLPQLALRWAISHPAVSTALVGCRTVAEVEDNVGAIGWSISDADLAEIDAIFARHGVDTVPDYWIEDD